MTTRDDTFDLYDQRVSLREAIWYADPGSVGTTITFDAALDGKTIDLQKQSLWLDESLTIDASSLHSLAIRAGEPNRVFTIATSENENVELTGLTITGGSVVGAGGGIYKYNGTLRVTDRALAGNSAHDGGGIYNDRGTLTLTSSRVEGNSARGYGGGIFNHFGVVSVVNSTFTSNSAGIHGGGIRNSIGRLTLVNSTMVGNSAAGSGGGVDSGGTLSVTNSSLVGNFASHGGGLYNDGSAEIYNSVIAGNTAAFSGPDIRHSYYGDDLLVGSFNLIGNGSDQPFTDGVDGNLIGSAEEPLDPMLSPWMSLPNGQFGYFVLANSPVIDAGNDALAVLPDGSPIETDIYGFARVANLGVNIGAVEYRGSGLDFFVADVTPKTINPDNNGEIVVTFSDSFRRQSPWMPSACEEPRAKWSYWT